MIRRPARSNKLTPLAHDLAGMRISVFAQPDPTLEDGLRALRRTRAEVHHVWPPTKRITSGMDVLICDYFPHLADAIPWEPGEAEAALVVLLPQGGGHDDADLCAAAPHGVIQRPCPGRVLVSATRVAFSQHRYEQRLRERIARLDENLRAIRHVERAKLVIMTRDHLDEAAAYRKLRETAMRRQVSIVDLAEAILRREELGI